MSDQIGTAQRGAGGWFGECSLCLWATARSSQEAVEDSLRSHYRTEHLERYPVYLEPRILQEPAVATTEIENFSESSSENGPDQ